MPHWEAEPGHLLVACKDFAMKGKTELGTKHEVVTLIDASKRPRIIVRRHQANFEECEVSEHDFELAATS